MIVAGSALNDPAGDAQRDVAGARGVRLPARDIRRADKREKVVSAAIKQFATVGVAETSMADVADAAGVSRMTLYRLFADRPALIDAILQERFAAIIASLRERIACCANLEEAILEGTLFGVRRALADTLALEILQAERGYAVESLVLHSPPAIRALYLETWRPLFAAARLSGELASKLSDERLIDGMLLIINPLMLRPDLNDAQRREFLCDFLLPALFRPAGRSTAHRVDQPVARHGRG